MNRAFQISLLQQADTKLDQAKDRLQEIEVILKDTTAINQAETELAQATKALEAARKVLRKAEENTQSQRLKIKNTEDQLYGGKIRNPKELQELQMESEALNRYLEVLEERQLEAMLIVDGLDATYQAAAKALNEQKARQIEMHAALNGENTELKKEIRKLLTERQIVAKPISKEDLSHYETLRQRRAGIALAKVRDKSCAACGTLLNTSLLQSALSSNVLAHCETCGRILYAG